MNNPSLQKPRVLMVQNSGDFYKNEVILQLRLRGKWLLAASLKPDTYVQITNPRIGELVIKSLDFQA